MKHEIEELLKAGFKQEILPDPALQEKILEQMAKKQKKTQVFPRKLAVAAGIVFCCFGCLSVVHFGFQRDNGKKQVDKLAVVTKPPEHTEESREEKEEQQEKQRGEAAIQPDTGEEDTKESINGETQEPVEKMYVKTLENQVLVTQEPVWKTEVKPRGTVSPDEKEKHKTKASIKPIQTEKPKESGKPEQSEKPKASGKPKQSEKPKASEPPVQTEPSEVPKTFIQKEPQPASEKIKPTEPPMRMLCKLEDSSYVLQEKIDTVTKPVETPIQETVVITGAAVSNPPQSTDLPTNDETKYGSFFQNYKVGDWHACVIDSESSQKEFLQTYQEKKWMLNGAWENLVSGIDGYDAAFFEENVLVLVCELERQESVFALDSVAENSLETGRKVISFRLQKQPKQTVSQNVNRFYHRAVIQVPKVFLYAYDMGEICVEDKKMEITW